jgi:hypothetical protein
MSDDCDWWGEMSEKVWRPLDEANRLARGDADFLALRAEYMGAADEDLFLLGLMRDRLMDKGVEDEVARRYVTELRLEHPSQEIPF